MDRTTKSSENFVQVWIMEKFYLADLKISVVKIFPAPTPFWAEISTSTFPGSGECMIFDQMYRICTDSRYRASSETTSKDYWHGFNTIVLLEEQFPQYTVQVEVWENVIQSLMDGNFRFYRMQNLTQTLVLKSFQVFLGGTVCMSVFTSRSLLDISLIQAFMTKEIFATTAAHLSTTYSLYHLQLDGHTRRLRLEIWRLAVCTTLQHQNGNKFFILHYQSSMLSSGLAYHELTRRQCARLYKATLIKTPHSHDVEIWKIFCFPSCCY